MEHLEGTRKQYFALKWELARKDEQVAELQKALSDAHIFLYEEREQVLKLAAENDELRIQELEDRKRIQHLLALTQPMSQEVTYFRDCRPGKVTRSYVVADKKGAEEANPPAPHREMDANMRRQVIEDARNRIAGTTASSSPASTTTSVVPASARPRSAGGNVVRTIYMPNESVDVLKLIIKSLRTQLDETAALAEQKLRALTEDRLIRETETREREEQHKRVVSQLREELDALVELHHATTRDYLDLRQESQKQEKMLREECVRLTAEAHAARRALAKALEEEKQRDLRRQKESEIFVHLFRKQALGSEEDLAIIKGQYEAAHELYEKRIKHLEARLAQTTAKLKACEEKRRLDREGFQSDIRALRTRLRDLERVLTGLRIVDEAGEVAPDPRVVRLKAFYKDFAEMKAYLDDVNAKLYNQH